MTGTFDDLAAAAVAREAVGDARFVLPRRPDPFVLAAALAVRTTRIRLVVEVDTAAVHPYVVARKLAALDKISDGQVEWLPHDDGPGRKAESVALVGALLESWRPGAVVTTRCAGSTSTPLGSRRCTTTACTGRCTPRWMWPPGRRVSCRWRCRYEPHPAPVRRVPPQRNLEITHAGPGVHFVQEEQPAAIADAVAALLDRVKG